MPEPITILIIGSLIAAGLAAIFWNDIREQVSEWLQKRGLSNSDLMDAWVEFELIRGQVTAKIFGRTKQYGKQKMSEKIYNPDEISDADVLKQLEQRGYATANIREMMN